MRKPLFILTLVLAVISSCSKVKDGNHTLDIYITSDIHGCYFSKFYLDDSLKPNSLSKVSAVVNTARGDGANVILIARFMLSTSLLPAMKT